MSLAVGERIGRYEILAPLGSGGMGEVYYARDPQLERSVAVKVLTGSRDASSLQLDRFQREARAIARMTHAHICTIHDVGEMDGVPFLVMELLEGETLAERLQRGPLPMDHAVIAACQIAEALDAAHKKGVVHRDLKPSNAMLTASGVKLLDFGLAKLRDAESADAIDLSTESLRLTAKGAILGTIPYMSPEQVEGREVDARTDIFSLGVILYEMTSGRPAFEGPSPASLISAILTHDPLPLSSVVPGVPPGVDRVLKKCLAKDPDERWQSAADLTAALLWIRDDSAAHRDIALANKRNHRQVWAGLVAALTIGAVVSGVAMWMFASSRYAARESAPIPAFSPLTFRTGSVSAARFAPDGETVIYSAAWGGEDYALFMTRRGSAESRPLGIPGAKLLSVSPTGNLLFLRGRHDAVKLLGPTGKGTLARVAITGGGPREILDDVVAADWTPNGDLAVVRRGQVEFPLGTTIHGPHGFSYVRIAPDGQKLALVEGANIVVLDRSGKQTTLSSGWGEMTTLAWSPSGDEVWFAAGGRRTQEWALRAVSLTGRERVVLPSSPGTGMAILDVFRDGRALVATQIGKMGCSCLPPGQAQTRELSWLDGSAPEALSADGRSLLLSELLRGAGENGSVYLRTTDGSDAIRLGDGYGEDLSPDGKWVLTTQVTSRRHWVLVPTGPGSPRALPPGPLVGRFEANFLPNGRQIVFGGREKDRGARIYIQDIDSGAIRAISPEGVVTEGLATPDSRYVIGQNKERLLKYAVDESSPVPLTYLDSDDVPLQWSADESVLYVRRMGHWPPVVDRVNATTGKREQWKTIQPADPSGVDSVLRILITPDGKSVLSRLRPDSVGTIHSRRVEVTAVSFGRFVLDLDTRELRGKGETVALSPKAYQLLEVLVTNRPKALAKSALQEQLWPGTFVVEKNLVNLIAEIRAALGDDATHPKFVRTVHRFGYAFRDPASELEARRPQSRRQDARFRLAWAGGRAGLSDGEYVLGRDPALELFLDARDVSRRHARITISANEATLEDLESKNGTFVADRRLDVPTRLVDGDSIRIGSVLLTFTAVRSPGSTQTEQCIDREPRM